MTEHLAAEKFGADLRAETDAEERLVVAQRHADPFDFAADEIITVIGTHRAAENDRGRMLGHSRGQRLAEARPPHVQRVAELLDGMADPAGRGVLLVQDDQDRVPHEPINSIRLKPHASASRERISAARRLLSTARTARTLIRQT